MFVSKTVGTVMPRDPDLEAAREAALAFCRDTRPDAVLKQPTFPTGFRPDNDDCGTHAQVVQALDEPAQLPGSLSVQDLSSRKLSSPRPSIFKRRPIHEGIVYRGETGLLVSPGGMAKSTYATTMCLAVASGQNLLCCDPGPSLNVLMINAEDCWGEVAMKFDASMQHHKLPAKVADTITIIGAEEASSLAFTTVDARGKERIRMDGFAVLDALIKVTGAKLVVIDPLTAVVPYGLNDNGLMTAMMKGLKAVGNHHDCGVLLVAHTRKGSDRATSGAEITAGAAAITNLARSVTAVGKPSAATCRRLNVPIGMEGDLRELQSLKANLKPLGEDQVFQIVSVNMKNGTQEYPAPDRVGVATEFVPPAAGQLIPAAQVKELVMAIARGVVIGGKHQPCAPNHQSKKRYYLTNVTPILAPHYPNRPTGIIKRAIQAVYDEALISGFIREDPNYQIGGAGGNLRGAALACWSQTPWATEPAPGMFLS